jgi:uncharacterized protein YecT (DUF1311 family)
LRTLNLLGALALGTLAFNAHAAGGEELYSPQFAACMDKAGGVTAKMIDCFSTETKAQDVRLNAAYKRLMEGLTPARKQELTEVQRMWLKYRDANCKFYADPDGGTLARVNANSCFLTATAERAEELQHLAE